METLRIYGEANRVGSNEYYLAWDCPITGDEEWAQGLFDVENESIYHDVTNEEMEVIYRVEATI